VRLAPAATTDAATAVRIVFRMVPFLSFDCL